MKSYQFEIINETKKYHRKEHTHRRSLESINALVLHHTAGASWRSSADWVAGLNNKSNKTDITMHYIIERDGTIHNLIPLHFWGWHTGKGSIIDKRSICIELCNIGGLNLHTDDDKIIYTNIYNRSFKEVFGDASSIHTCSKEWRYYNCFERYYNPQIESLKVLIKEIEKYCPSLDITKSTYLCPEDVDTDHKTITGILSHSNIRKAYEKPDGSLSGKWDLSPAILEHFPDGRFKL